MSPNFLYIVTFDTPHSYIKTFTSNEKPEKVYQDHIHVYSNIICINSQNKVDTDIKLYYFANPNEKIMLSILNELEPFSHNFYQFDKEITLLEKLLQNCKDTQVILNRIKGILNSDKFYNYDNKLILYNSNTTCIDKETKETKEETKETVPKEFGMPLAFDVYLSEFNNNIRIDISKKNNKQFQEYNINDITNDDSDIKDDNSNIKDDNSDVTDDNSDCDSLPDLIDINEKETKTAEVNKVRSFSFVDLGDSVNNIEQFPNIAHVKQLSSYQEKIYDSKIDMNNSKMHLLDTSISNSFDNKSEESLFELPQPEPLFKSLCTTAKLSPMTQCTDNNTSTYDLNNDKDAVHTLFGEQGYENVINNDYKKDIPLIDPVLYDKMEKYIFESSKTYKDIINERNSLSFEKLLPTENNISEPTGNSKNYLPRKRQFFNFGDYASVEDTNPNDPNNSIKTSDLLDANIAFIEHKGKLIQNALLVTGKSLLLVKEMSYFNEFVILNEFITPEDPDYYSCVQLKINKLLTKDNKNVHNIINEIYSILSSVNTFLGYQSYDSFLTTQIFNKKTTTMDKILKYFKDFSERYTKGKSESDIISLYDIKDKFHKYLLEKEDNALIIDEINKYESAICQYLVFYKDASVYVDENLQKVFRLKEEKNRTDIKTHTNISSDCMSTDFIFGKSNYQLQIPRVKVSPWLQSTIEPSGSIIEF